ncbi:MAG: hypothetical protein M1837_005626 [Sclerophora amabilis]|nr:MAG: hypothetical protein M1837_005626 [Sclerophora amabilis]
MASPLAAPLRPNNLRDTGSEEASAADAPSATFFPQTPEEFDADPRVSFSKTDQKWILEAEDGAEFEYEEALGRWVVVMDEALLEQQREAYAVAGVDENAPARPPKKRKNEYVNGEEGTGHGSGKAKKSKHNGEAPPPRKNTAVYVTNLPVDTTIDEVHSLFSKCGVIAEEIDQGKPRIKLYSDEHGTFKGDALILYFRAESVDLAIQMLDDTDFRFGEAGPSGKMKVQAADFSYKSQQDAPAKSSMKDKKKIIRKTQRLNNKLADWDDDDPSTIQDTSSRWDKVVILKHMFTLQELEEDPAAILDIKDDIRQECSKLGEVTNVVLFDREPDGVASVRYSNAEAAKACVRTMNGRFFSGTQVIAYISEGIEKFKKSTDRKVSGVADEDEADDAKGGGQGDGDDGAHGDQGMMSKEEKKRLDQFGTWLEQQQEEQQEEEGKEEGKES